jgi:hypothetical protein
MPETEEDIQRHPANAVFALMEDREFRHSVVRGAVEHDKTGLSRLTTGKHQLRGFRHIGKAPTVMLVPVLSDDANDAPDLAKAILDYWLEDNAVLRAKVAARLRELGYEPAADIFDAEGLVAWKPMKHDDATLQYDGAFVEDEDKNAVMLMSLLLGWFGSDRDGEDAESEEEHS